jgi:hypothetical protein
MQHCAVYVTKCAKALTNDSFQSENYFIITKTSLVHQAYAQWDKIISEVASLY